MVFRSSVNKLAWTHNQMYFLQYNLKWTYCDCNFIGSCASISLEVGGCCEAWLYQENWIYSWNEEFEVSFWYVWAEVFLHHEIIKYSVDTITELAKLVPSLDPGFLEKNQFRGNECSKSLWNIEIILINEIRNRFLSLRISFLTRRDA